MLCISPYLPACMLGGQACCKAQIADTCMSAVCITAGSCSTSTCRCKPCRASRRTPHPCNGTRPASMLAGGGRGGSHAHTGGQCSLSSGARRTFTPPSSADTPHTPPPSTAGHAPKPPCCSSAALHAPAPCWAEHPYQAGLAVCAAPIPNQTPSRPTSNSECWGRGRTQHTAPECHVPPPVSAGQACCACCCCCCCSATCLTHPTPHACPAQTCPAETFQPWPSPQLAPCFCAPFCGCQLKQLRPGSVQAPRCQGRDSVRPQTPAVHQV